MAKSNKPLVSIIIPARNEEKNIEECIKSVKTQSYRKIQIIVVDGGSTDNTVKIALENGAKVIREKPVRSPGNARNIGAKLASGEIVAFIDADNVIEKNYIKKAVDFLMKHEDIDGISPDTMIYPTKNLVPNLYFTERLSARRGVSPVIIWRKSFLRVMFDPSLGIGEDYDMSQRFVAKGFKYIFLKNIKTYHKEPDFDRIVSESKWWGRTYITLLRKGHPRIILSFIWISSVALMLPGILISYYISFIKSPVFLMTVIFILYSLLKIFRALLNGAKFKYAVFLPLFKILRYTLLFIGILSGFMKKKNFSGE